MSRLAFLNKELGTNYISLDEVNWSNISRHKKLSEEFIREFQDKINWYFISSRYQKLSEEFIREFQSSIYWGSISNYQKLKNQNFQ